MLACARIGAPPHRRLRRLLCGVAVRPPERHGVRAPDHSGRGLARRQEGAAEAERGRRRGGTHRPSRRSSSIGRTGGRRRLRSSPRPLVDELVADKDDDAGVMSLRAHGRRRTCCTCCTPSGTTCEAEGESSTPRPATSSAWRRRTTTSSTSSRTRSTGVPPTSAG
jgi:hypothetical protein